MTFSHQWEEAYIQARQMSSWPWSDLVSFIKRHTKAGPQTLILELGCGSGANTPFFLSLNTNYFAVDGSPSVVNEVQRRFPELGDRVKVADFTKEIPFRENMDIIFDRAAITHNTSDTIRQTMLLIHRKLKIDGLFIGIDWFSTAHSCFEKGGQPVTGDPFSRTHFKEGCFADLGVVHFTDEKHLRDLLDGLFEITVLEHKLYSVQLPHAGQRIGMWNFVAKKINQV